MYFSANNSSSVRTLPSAGGDKLYRVRLPTRFSRNSVPHTARRHYFHNLISGGGASPLITVARTWAWERAEVSAAELLITAIVAAQLARNGSPERAMLWLVSILKVRPYGSRRLAIVSGAFSYPSEMSINWRINIESGRRLMCLWAPAA